MTIDVQLTWPGLAEALKTYECREVRVPRVGETFLNHDGDIEKWHGMVHATTARPILTPRWRFPSDKLPGAAAISYDTIGGVSTWRIWWTKPYFPTGAKRWDSRSFLSDQMDVPFPHLLERLCGITLPTPTGDPAKDIWLNPDHPANNGE